MRSGSNPLLHKPIDLSYLQTVGIVMAAITELITKNPEILGGTPVFRGTRVPFQNLLDYLEAGQTIDEFLDDFPTVSREAAVEALEHAKALVIGLLQ